jgi:cytochrome P450
MTNTDVAYQNTFAIPDLASPEIVADPYPIYDQLRDRSPFFGYRDLPPGTVPGIDEPVPSWVLLNYDDVAAAAMDNETFSSEDPTQAQSSAPTLMLVNHDEPRHNQLRKVVNVAFSRRRIDKMKPWLDDMLADMFAKLVPAGKLNSSFDFAEGFASLMPARVMAHLYGVSDEVSMDFRRWASAFMLSADLTPEQRGVSNQEMVAYFTKTVTEIVEGKQQNSGLISALIAAEDEGDTLTLDEVIRFCHTLVVAGAETTTGMLANVTYQLATLPDIQDQLRQDRSLIPDFVEETLRLTGPPQRLFRIATRDVELSGAQIRKGDWVAIFFGAANRDPGVFDDPDVFRLGRHNVRKHMSFGIGVHHCLGMRLAKLETECALNALLDCSSSVELGAAAFLKQTASLLTHTYTYLPITVLRAS